MLATVYRSESDQVQSVIALGDQLEQMQAARNALAESGAALYASLGQVDKRARTGLSGWLASPWVPLVFIVITLLAVAASIWLQRELAALRQAAEHQGRQNERNQQAILRLLDELSSLADGDLTVQATVTEDITGAIADSINYAIEALRELVVTINDSAIKLDAATRQTQALSTHLAKASSAQSKQIGSASESITAMAASTEEVSGNAERAADVARHSVDIAHKGGDAVRRTIDGMNAIRENIQETSKRIKRLGESSQEIGNIVELINDIAEQTNILALNASIQASMAGEAGRGFAVVADEVQRLAERAANATKQIEVLVRTIQADTNEAVVSMERTTTDVVGGALLAENAGASLEEIEQVSNQIASLVQNISASSRQQAGVSQSISRNMQVLREISSQTAESTSATSSSIGKLAELAAQLRKSVDRLPAAGVDEIERHRRVPGSARRRRRGGRTACAASAASVDLRDIKAVVSTGPLTLASVDEAHASLQVIAREIAAELNEARVALEAFAERPEDRGALHRFAAHVHLARGALRLAEVYGGSLLAEEMEHVARYVDLHSGEGRRRHRRPRRADARDGAAAVLRRTRRLRRARRAARAAAAAERPARGPRQRAALRRHAAAAQPALGRAGPARLGACGRPRDRGPRAAPAPALPARAARLDPRRERRGQPRAARRDRQPVRGRIVDAAAVPAVVGRRGRARVAAPGRPRRATCRSSGCSATSIASCAACRSRVSSATRTRRRSNC